LKNLVSRAEALTTSITLLRRDARADLGSGAEISAVSGRIETLASEFTRDVTSVLKPRALDTLKLTELLDQIEGRVLSTWKGYLLGAEPADGGDSVLGHYPAYKRAAVEIAILGRQLREIANVLPTDAATVARAKKLHSKLSAERLAVVTREGLSDAVIDFLARAVEGVSMAEVLRNAEVLEWLGEQNHAAGFRVRRS
jgi:hypothetical protein